jgi:hypothetical protein
MTSSPPPPSAPPSVPPRNATLVVVEFDGIWPRWLDPTQNSDTALVAQHYEGEPSSLIAQVANRITRLEAGGWSISSMVLVASGRTDPDAIAARSILARCLLARLKTLGRGRLTMTASDQMGSRTRKQLVHLAATLNEGLGPSVALSVRAGNGAPLYGCEETLHDLVAQAS